MSRQTSMDELFWEQGVDRRCIKAPTAKCIYEPCVVASGVRCCKECRRCGSPCPRTRRDA